MWEWKNLNFSLYKIQSSDAFAPESGARPSELCVSSTLQGVNPESQQPNLLGKYVQTVQRLHVLKYSYLQLSYCEQHRHEELLHAIFSKVIFQLKSFLFNIQIISLKSTPVRNAHPKTRLMPGIVWHRYGNESPETKFSWSIWYNETRIAVRIARLRSGSIFKHFKNCHRNTYSESDKHERSKWHLLS